MPLSFTQLASYRRCPRQYEYCYVKKIPKGISPGEAFGAAVHNALKKWGEEELRIGELRMENSSKQLEMFAASPVAPVADLTVEALKKIWHENFPLDSFATRVEADMARIRGKELMRFFFDWWKQSPRAVVAVEKGFSVAVEGITLTGRFDRIEKTSEGLHIIDFKTSPPRSQAEVDADLQLSIYAKAALEVFGALPAKLSLLHSTEEGVTEMQTTRSKQQVLDAMKQIGSLHGRIQEKDFRPTPGVTVCRNCPYRTVCDVAAV